MTVHTAPPAHVAPSRRLCRVLAISVAGAALAGSSALAAFAVPGQTSSDTTIARVEVNSAIVLTALTPSFTLVGLPGATVESTGAVTFTVETNNVAGYIVTVQAEDDELLPAGGGNPDTIPIGALEVRETGVTGYTGVTDAAPVTVHRQTTRSAEGGDDLSNDYRVTIPFVADDTYSVTLDYIATTL